MYINLPAKGQGRGGSEPVTFAVSLRGAGRRRITAACCGKSATRLCGLPYAGGTPNKRDCGRPQPRALWAKYYLAYGHAVCNIIFLPAEFPACAGVILLCFAIYSFSRISGVQWLSFRLHCVFEAQLIFSK